MLRIKLRYETVDSFVDRFAIYINRIGMFLRSPAPKPVGTSLIIELRLANDTQVLECEGVVRWIRGRNQDQPAFSQGMGVEFVDLTPESQEIIALIEEVRAERGWDDAGIPGAPDDLTPEAVAPGPVDPASPVAPPRRRRVTVEELMARAMSAAAPVAPDAYAGELDELMAGDASAVVSRALARARELASQADDQELEGLLAASSEPATASADEASSWLAAHLGGSAVPPRARPAARPRESARPPAAPPASRTQAARATARRTPAPARSGPVEARPAQAPPVEPSASRTATVVNERPDHEHVVAASSVAAQAYEDAAATMELASNSGAYPAIEIVDADASEVHQAQPVDDAPAAPATYDPDSFPATEIHVASLPAIDEDDDLMVTIEVDGDEALDSMVGRAARRGSSVDEESTVVREDPSFGSGALEDGSPDEATFIFEEPSGVEGKPFEQADLASPADAEWAPEQPADSERASTDLLLDDDFGLDFDFRSEGDSSGFFDVPHYDSGPVLFRQSEAETQFGDVPTLAIEAPRESVSKRTDSTAEPLPTIPPGPPPGYVAPEPDEIDALVDSLDFDAGALDADGLRASNLAELSSESSPSVARDAASEGRPGDATPEAVLDSDSDFTLAEPVDEFEEIEPLEIDPDMLEPADDDEDDMAVLAPAFAKPPPLPPGASRPPPVPPAPPVAPVAADEDDEADDKDKDPSKRRGFFSRIFNK